MDGRYRYAMLSIMILIRFIKRTNIERPFWYVHNEELIIKCWREQPQRYMGSTGTQYCTQRIGWILKRIYFGA